MYGKRRDNMIKRLSQILSVMDNKHRFISDIISGKLKIFGKKKDEILQLLKDLTFKQWEDIYPAHPSKAELLAPNESAVSIKD